MMEAIRYFETSDLAKTTRRNVPEDYSLGMFDCGVEMGLTSFRNKSLSAPL
jgi:hypothetical protein